MGSANALDCCHAPVLDTTWTLLVWAGAAADALAVAAEGDGRKSDRRSSVEVGAAVAAAGGCTAVVAGKGGAR